MDEMLWGSRSETDRESDGFLSGLAVGVVTDNQDPDGLARVRVQLPWHLRSGTSYWARSAMPLAGNDRGTYFLPEIGDEVLVGAEDGDPSHLYVLGMLWNGRQTPPVQGEGSANNTRMIKSRSGHTLRFNDDPGKPEVEVGLADGKQILLDRDTVVISDGRTNVITFTATSGSIEISAGQQLSLKAGSVSIDATSSVSITASGTLALRGGLVQIN